MACVKKRRNRWVLDFYDQDGKRRWKTMPEGCRKDEAIDELAKVLKTTKRGTYTAAKSIPLFPELADKWLNSKKTEIRHSTHVQYSGHVEKHLKPYFKRFKANQINFEAVETFKHKSLEGGTTPVTFCKILITLGGILKYAIKLGYIDFNSCAEVKRPKSAEADQDDMVILRPEQNRLLFDAAHDQRDRILYMTAVLTGLRQGELFGLQWPDFDWDSSQVLVRRTFNHQRFYSPKTASSRRRVDLPPQLASELKRWKLACPPGEHDLVFPTSAGAPEYASSFLKRRFYPALRRAGLPLIRFHDLRHGYASLLIAQGENPKYIQVQLGHKHIKTTMDVYGHLFDKVNREAANKLGETILGSSDGNGSKRVAVGEPRETGHRVLH